MIKAPGSQWEAVYSCRCCPLSFYLHSASYKNLGATNCNFFRALVTFTHQIYITNIQHIGSYQSTQLCVKLVHFSHLSVYIVMFSMYAFALEVTLNRILIEHFYLLVLLHHLLA